MWYFIQLHCIYIGVSLNWEDNIFIVTYEKWTIAKDLTVIYRYHIDMGAFEGFTHLHKKMISVAQQ